MNTSRIIAIDAQIPTKGVAAGIEQNLVALIKALGTLEGPEKYVIVCHRDDCDWPKAYLGDNSRVVIGPVSQSRVLARRILGRRGYDLLWRYTHKLAGLIRERFNLRQTPPGYVTYSNGFYEGLNAEILLVTSQKNIKTDVATMYMPYDFQYEYFPEFFTPEGIAVRRYITSHGCLSAAAVVAGSQFTKDDVVRFCNVPPERVWVIPTGAAISAFEKTENCDVDNLFERLNIRRPFILYPAQTWPHKNHLRLIDAIASLRDRGPIVNLVCTGKQVEPTWSKVCAAIEQYKLNGQVRFLGFVAAGDLKQLYRHCEFVVAPSLFEQASGPMYEAWHAGVPICAGAVTSVPAQAGDAALLFDPLSVSAIADAVGRMATDSSLRSELTERGTLRLAQFTWLRTAKAFRALFRHTAKWELTEEDRSFLGWDWMTHPRQD